MGKKFAIAFWGVAVAVGVNSILVDVADNKAVNAAFNEADQKNYPHVKKHIQDNTCHMLVPDVRSTCEKGSNAIKQLDGKNSVEYVTKHYQLLFK